MLQNIRQILIILVLILFVLISSCRNQNSPTEFEIIGGEFIKTTIINNPQEQLISDSAFAIVKSLFQKNNLSLSNLQVYRLLILDGFSYVRCYQFYQGYELYTNDVVFVFDKQGLFNSRSGDLVININIDTKPNLNADIAGNLFYREIENDPWYKDSVNYFLHQGFNAELGIYDLNAGSGNAQKHFVPAWKMTITDNEFPYPIAYIRADSLSLIYYTNGLVE